MNQNYGQQGGFRPPPMANQQQNCKNFYEYEYIHKFLKFKI